MERWRDTAREIMHAPVLTFIKGQGENMTQTKKKLFRAVLIQFTLILAIRGYLVVYKETENYYSGKHSILAQGILTLCQLVQHGLKSGRFQK